MTDETSDRMLRAALRYAALGWYVFPLQTTGDVKEPHGMLGKPGGHNRASIDPDELRAWWKASPTSGIGLNLARSGLIAVDTDPRAGGNETIARLEKARGPLPSAIVSETGGGGDHRLFLAPPDLRSAPGRLGPPKGGVDLKYNGYIVLPPSLWAGKGPDGRFAPPSARYRWRTGCDPFGFALNLLGPIPAWTLSSGSETAPRIGPADDEDVFREDTPVVGLTTEEMQSHLALIPNTGDDELDYDDWTGVLAGIFHETGGSNEGRALALEFSQRSMKHLPEDFDKKWPSFNIEGKGRAPITFRFVLKLANDRKKIIEAVAVKDLETAIMEAADVGELKAAATRAKTIELDPLFRNVIMNQIRKRYKLITGDMLSITDARSLVRYEDPEVRELPSWLRGWVYCTLDDKFFRVGTNESITTRAFNAANNIHMLSRKELLEGRANPETQASDAALNRYQVPKVHGRMYLPGEESEFIFQGSRWLNTYTDVSVPPMPEALTSADRAAIRRVEEHFAMLIPDPGELRLVLSWFAYIVQTLKRPNWALCIQGPEGNGKSFIGAMMGAVLGSENVNVIFANTIQSSDFNSWAEGSLLNIIEEVKQHSQNRHLILDRLQVLVTNDVIEIHKKNVNPYNAVNTAALCLFTNHRDALPISAGDTRYFLTASRLQTKEEVQAFKTANPDYFSLLFDCVNDHAPALRHWLMSLTLAPGFNPLARAPHSIEHDHAVRLNTSDMYSVVQDILRAGADPALSRGLVDMTKLKDAITQAGEMVPYGRALSTVLTGLGYSHLGRFKVGGAYGHFWTARLDLFPQDEGSRAHAIRTIFADPLGGL